MTAAERIVLLAESLDVTDAESRPVADLLGQMIRGLMVAAELEKIPEERALRIMIVAMQANQEKLVGRLERRERPTTNNPA